jgi:predicted 3-demethylubiquinone-9 3-methyltransferase (glyoxalase superfamily)
MTAVTPCLWFDGVAEEATRFYTSLLPDSRIERVNHAPTDTPSGPAGGVLTVEFTLGGRPHLALNGGPAFRFTEALSLVIACEDQAEVDRLWDALTADGGAPGPCGWCKDRYGLSWQVVPRGLPDMLADPDRARAGRVMRALLGMSKLDLPALHAAAAQPG